MLNNTNTDNMTTYNYKFNASSIDTVAALIKMIDPVSIKTYKVSGSDTVECEMECIIQIKGLLQIVEIIDQQIAMSINFADQYDGTNIRDFHELPSFQKKELIGLR